MSVKVAIKQIDITETPDGTKFLRDDGSWQPLPLGVATIVNTITGKSFTSVGDHLIYTVPAGKQFIAQRVIVRLTSISGTGSVPKVSIGTISPNYDNIYSNNSLSGLTATLDGFSISIEGTFRIAQAGAGVYLRVNNTASYTTYVCSVDLIGFEK